MVGHYDLLIWDYNGTIIDDVQTGIDSVNILLQKRGIQTIDSLEYYQSIFGFPIRDYYCRLGFDFNKESYETVAQEWVKEYLKREKDIPLQNNVLEMLQFFKDMGMKQIILSSCEKEMMICELEFYGLTSYFEEILGQSNIYGRGKIEIALEYMKDLNHHAILVGDTTHDYKTAQAIGSDCILFYSSHENIDDLRKNHVPVISNLRELAAYIK